MKREIRKNDLIFLVAAVLLVLLVYILSTNFQRAEGEVAEVTIDGELYGTYSLKEDQTVNIEIEGTVVNILTIQDGSADMTDATCKDRLCVHQASISKNGETIVCLPHKVVVKVISDEKPEVDVVAG